MHIPTLNEAQAMDATDALAPHRAAFHLPPDLIYLDGNSLGPLPHRATASLERTVRQHWGEGLIRSWSDAGWMAAPARVGAKIARVIGAAPDEVVVADSTSVNLFKLLAAARQLRPDRHEILIEAGNFPTDRHVAEGLAALLPDVRVRVAPSADMATSIGANTAVVLLCHVHYRGGDRYPMAAWNAAARAAGALVVWDISHSAGAVALRLNLDGAELAVGCGYKFLNGGPGAPAFLYVAQSLQEAARSPIPGWIGHAAPFAFNDEYHPAAGVARFQSGTPAVLGLAALEAGVDEFLAADPALLWAKSARMFELFATLAHAWCPALHLLTPREPSLRGSHISFRHPNAAAIMAALIEAGVVGDFRPPDILRFGLTPLYGSFADIWLAAHRLAEIVNRGP